VAAVTGETKPLPGEAELGALGCPRTLVFDSAWRIERLADHLDGGTGAVLRGERLAVMCALDYRRHGESASAERAPTCDEVAATYARAVGGSASAPFVVSVADQWNHSDCDERYLANGTRRPVR
jgi:hypothetical protein